jgi:hypothetical protein
MNTPEPCNFADIMYEFICDVRTSTHAELVQYILYLKSTIKSDFESCTITLDHSSRHVEFAKSYSIESYQFDRKIVLYSHTAMIYFIMIFQSIIDKKPYILYPHRRISLKITDKFTIDSHGKYGTVFTYHFT